MEYDYEPSEDYAGRVLWGRVGVFAAALLLVFLAGRCSAGGGEDAQQVELLQAQVNELVEQRDELRSQVDALSAGQRTVVPDAEATPTETPTPGADGETTTGDAAARTHTVQRNDTLYSLAIQYYGDGSKYTLIADANGIDSTNPLTVGQELTIPPDPDA